MLADMVEGHRGPLAGLLTGMIWARDLGATRLVSVPTDSPFLPADLVLRLSNAAGEHPGVPVLAASGGRAHPVVGLWPVTLAGRLLDFLVSDTNYKVSAFAEACEAVTTEFPMITLRDRTVDPFFNVNTPDDLALAAELLQRVRR